MTQSGVQDQAGVDGVHPDVHRDELVRHVLRQHQQRGLGHVVDRLVPQRLRRADRGVVEDRPAAALGHHRHQPAGEADGGHDVEVPVVEPLVVGGVEDGLVRAGAGVVDEDVAAAEGMARRLDEAGAARGRRDVAGVGDDRLAEVLGDLRRGVLGAVAVAGGDEHERALAGEGAGDAEPDADAAAGDDGDLAGEPRSMARVILPGKRWAVLPSAHRLPTADGVGAGTDVVSRSPVRRRRSGAPSTGPG